MSFAMISSLFVEVIGQSSWHCPPRRQRWHLNNPWTAKSRQLLGNFVPQTPYRASAPGPRWWPPELPPPSLFSGSVPASWTNLATTRSTATVASPGFGARKVTKRHWHNVSHIRTITQNTVLLHCVTKEFDIPFPFFNKMKKANFNNSGTQNSKRI